MPLIQVTAIIDTDDLPVTDVDLSDPTGFTESAYIDAVRDYGTLPMQDIDFQLLEGSD
jgi:hypothetical protein